MRAAIGRHPNHATGFGDATPTSSPSSRRGGRELVAAIGETGLDFFRDTRPARRPGARLPRAARARPRPGQAARHPHARGGGRRRSRRCAPAPTASRSSCTASRCPTTSTSASSAAGGSPSPGNVTYPANGAPRRRRRARPRRPPARRDGRAVPHAAAGPQGAQPAGVRACTPPASWPSAAGRRQEELEAVVDAQRRAALRLVSATPAARPSPACAACASSACARSRDLGQNFLVDSNILGVIERAAELDAGRRRARDRRRPRASSASTSRRARRTSTSWRSTARSCRRCATRSTPTRTRRSTSPTRWRSTCARSTPRRRRSSPTCPTASRRARSCARSRSCPPSTRWVAMVQKEVGERLAAAARARRLRRAVGAGAAGCRRARAPRGLADGLPPGAQRRLACSSSSAHRARRAPAAAPRWSSGRLRPPAQGARRARSRSRRAPRRGSATRARAALVRLGPSPRRALARRAARAPHEELARAGRGASAPPGRSSSRERRGAARGGAREAQPLPVPRPGPPERRPPRARHRLPAADAGRPRAAWSPRRSASPRDEVVCPGVDPGDNLALPRRCAPSASATRLGGAARPAGDRQAHPGRRRHGRRVGRRRRGAAPGRPRVRHRRRRPAARGRRRAGRRRPGAGAPGAHTWPTGRASASARPARAAAVRRPASCARRGGLSTAAVFAEADRQGLARDRAELARGWPRSSARRGRRRSGCRAELLVNDLEPAARALCPRSATRWTPCAPPGPTGAAVRLGPDRGRAVRRPGGRPRGPCRARRRGSPRRCWPGPGAARGVPA